MESNVNNISSDSFLDKLSCSNLSINNRNLSAKSSEISIAFEISLDSFDEPASPSYDGAETNIAKRKLDFGGVRLSNQNDSKLSSLSCDFQRPPENVSPHSNYFNSPLSPQKSDKLELGVNNLSCDDSNVFDLSVDKDAETSYPKSNSSRSSEQFRNEITKIDLMSSPNISLNLKDLDGSPVVLSLDNTANSSCSAQKVIKSKDDNKDRVDNCDVLIHCTDGTLNESNFSFDYPGKLARTSELFRLEMTKMNIMSSPSISLDLDHSPAELSIDNTANSSSLPEESAINSPEDKTTSYANRRGNNNKNHVSSIAVLSNNDSNSPSHVNRQKSIRFSEYFRNEMSKLNISTSPNVSLDLNELAQSPVVLSVDNSVESNIKADEAITSNYLQHSSKLTDSNCSHGNAKEVSSRGTSVVQLNGDHNTEGYSVVRSDVLSEDESEDSFVIRKTKKSTAVISSDEEISYDENCIKNIKNSVKVTQKKVWNDEDDSESDDMSDFIVDDDVVIYENENDDLSAEEEELFPADLSDSLEDLSDSPRSCDSEKENTNFMTPLSRPLATPKTKGTKFYTPRTKQNSPNKTNPFRTPTSFCYSPTGIPASSTPAARTPAASTPATRTPASRRRTEIAPPLSVASKTGTPASANPTYKRNMIKAARELFVVFNKNVFKDQLPADLEIKLNKRLNTTAGRCVYLRKLQEYRVYIELSPKVVDCLERLKETLAHELCHAAAFIINKKMDNHGPVWRMWAQRVNDKYPELPPVTRCHSYEISYKYNYRCTSTLCTYKIGRYTKSIDLKTARCPYCYQQLYVEETSKSSRAGKHLNPWTDYVKKNFSRVKEANPFSTPHKDIMKLLSDEFKSISLQQTL